MSSSPTESTPEPAYKAAASVGAAIPALITIAGAAVMFGWLSTEQYDALTTVGNQLVTNLPALATAITVVLSIVTGLVGSFVTAWQTRKKVIPTDSDVFVVAPADPATGPLTTP